MGTEPSGVVYKSDFHAERTVTVERIETLKERRLLLRPFLCLTFIVAQRTLLPYIEDIVKVQQKHEDCQSLIRKHQEVSARTICGRRRIIVSGSLCDTDTLLYQMSATVVCYLGPSCASYVHANYA